MKRKRIKTKGTMVAWSNGRKVHVSPVIIKALRDEYQQKLDELQLVEMRRYSVREIETLALKRSRLLEEYSFWLWEADLHASSLRVLLRAAEETLAEGTVDFDIDEVPYNHPNLVAFRRLVQECRYRVSQDCKLSDTLYYSDVWDDYQLMNEVYSDF